MLFIYKQIYIPLFLTCIIIFLLFYTNDRILIVNNVFYRLFHVNMWRASLFFYGYIIFLYIDVTPLFKQITNFGHSDCLQTLLIPDSAAFSILVNIFLSFKSFLCEYLRILYGWVKFHAHLVQRTHSKSCSDECLVHSYISQAY